VADHILGIGLEPLLGRSELAAHQRLGLGVEGLPVVHFDQGADGRPHVRIVGTAVLFFRKDQHTFVQRLGIGVTALKLVVGSEAIEREPH
jgi:hypothetical protein